MQIGGSVLNQKHIANSVDLDVPSGLDLHCLHRYLFWSAGLKGLMFCELNLNIVTDNITTCVSYFTKKPELIIHANCFVRIQLFT